MSLAHLAVPDSVKGTEETDALGGGGALDSAVYPLTVDVAYMSKSKNGAHAVNFQMSNDKNISFRTTMYVTNKAGETFYIDKKTGDQRQLPGMSQVNSITDMLVGKPVAALDTEEKVIMLYDFDQGKEVPTKVECLVDLHGKSAAFGLVHVKENKNALNQSTGQYEPTAEIREFNEIDKVFDAQSGLTNLEKKAGVTTPEVLAKWKKKWKDNVKDKTVAVASTGATAGAPGAVAPTEPTENIFG